LSHAGRHHERRGAAYVWAISGSAAEKEPNPANRELTFRYRMNVHIENATNSTLSFTTLSTELSASRRRAGWTRFTICA